MRDPATPMMAYSPVHRPEDPIRRVEGRFGELLVPYAWGSHPTDEETHA